MYPFNGVHGAAADTIALAMGSEPADGQDPGPGRSLGL